jgi:hypothetical protein
VVPFNSFSEFNKAEGGDIWYGNKFTFPNVYTQWRAYWRREMSTGLDVLAQAKTANYFVEMGGEVSEAGSDSADEVCTFLFHLY